MKFSKVCILSGLIAIVLAASVNCGRRTRVQVQTETKTTTKGQELKDIHEVYEKGIITEKEYKKQKS